MSEVFEVTSAQDRRLALRATGVLGRANAAGILTASDVHVADRLCALAGEESEAVRLAVALATRGVRLGSVCVDLDTVPQVEPAFDWPEPDAWRAAVAASPLLAAGVVRLDLGLLYLDRYRRDEVAVCHDLLDRAGTPPELGGAAADAALEESLERVFPGDGYAEQRDASRRAAGQAVTVLTGGPGTGKTTTVAGLLAVLAEQAERAGGERGRLRIALTAPTGKAAARLGEATAAATARLPTADRDRLGSLPASTMHRLLGSLPGRRTRFRHDRSNRLPHDVVVVDEMSMVSLTMMARLLEALRPGARLVLVGDPDQLASVDAGAVLADLVAGFADRDRSPVVRLRVRHRFGVGIGALADAVRDGDGDGVLALLRSGDPAVEFVEVPDAPEGADPADAGRALLEATADTLRPRLVRHALDLREAAVAGDADTALRLLAQHRLLCAHRRGPYGVAAWNRYVEQWLAELGGIVSYDPMYDGRPLLVTANDYASGLFNGDTGVVLRAPDHDGPGRRGPVAVFDGAQGRLTLAAARLGDVDTMHAMTVHKSQGSQADHVTILLPGPESALLTRELLYTGLTRAQSRVTIVGSEDGVRAAVDRRVQRATGLRRRLAGPG
ncbi:exodeoxyribonuclease V subunit alpha [Agilicoccus flavus]|uniref:exodeoxyribonuclease V subunit alpha n=1 Tax=Agilicoccus flavus TaxID=2775968 RepID=UPI001CF6714D|nr:exodeoxyribonuclease V subunit alpha [Agilicoccus flavus]